MDARFLDKLAGHKQDFGVQPFCLACGYDLRGSPSMRCPECGEPFDHREWEREMRESLHRIGAAEEAVQYVTLGLLAACIGVAGRALGFFFPLYGVGSWLGRLTAAVCGFAAICLALSVLRARQLPPWAQARMSAKPNYWVAGLTGGLGAALLVTAILLP